MRFTVWSGNKCQIIRLTSEEAQDLVCKSVILIPAMSHKHVCDMLKMLCSRERAQTSVFYFPNHQVFMRQGQGDLLG